MMLMGPGRLCAWVSPETTQPPSRPRGAFVSLVATVLVRESPVCLDFTRLPSRRGKRGQVGTLTCQGTHPCSRRHSRTGTFSRTLWEAEC